VALFRLAKPASPNPAKPMSIIAHVEASGTAGELTLTATVVLNQRLLKEIVWFT
jgi:hypothetical protein